VLLFVVIAVISVPKVNVTGSVAVLVTNTILAFTVLIHFYAPSALPYALHTFLSFLVALSVIFAFTALADAATARFADTSAAAIAALAALLRAIADGTPPPPESVGGIRSQLATLRKLMFDARSEILAFGRNAVDLRRLAEVHDSAARVLDCASLLVSATGEGGEDEGSVLARVELSAPPAARADAAGTAPSARRCALSLASLRLSWPWRQAKGRLSSARG
jgi:hypothetical protein